MIDKWQAQGIEVTIVEIPTCETLQYYAKYFREEYGKLRTDLQSNYNFIAKDEFGHNPLYFGDIGHLNRFGGREYTQYILHKLGHNAPTR